MNSLANMKSLAPVQSLGRLRRALDDLGMSTAEYAVGTVGACTIGGVLVKVGQSQWFGDLIKNVIDSGIKALPFF